MCVDGIARTIDVIRGLAASDILVIGELLITDKNIDDVDENIRKSLAFHASASDPDKALATLLSLNAIYGPVRVCEDCRGRGRDTGGDVCDACKGDGCMVHGGAVTGRWHPACFEF